MIEIIDCKEIQNNKQKILVIGEVQSGKTTYILDSILNSTEHLFDLCIFFGGTSNVLFKQTFDRTKEFFKTKNFNKNIQIFNINSLQQISINSVLSNKNLFPIFIVLKGYDQLDKIESILFDNFNFKNKNCLIIDDEADYASININNNSIPSAIYKLICKIYSNLNQVKLLSVTATPFANLLCNENDILYPDSLHLLPTNYDYTGSNFFWNINNKIYIPLDASKIKEETWDNSLKLSLTVWLISTALYELSNQEKQINSEFLINIDVTTPSHKKIKQSIYNNLSKFYTYFELWWKSEYCNYAKKMYSEYLCIFPNDILQNKVHNILQYFNKTFSNKYDTPIYLLNSQNKSSTEEWYSGRDKYSIIIGGHLLSRGVTFKHLITELILNAPEKKSSADTMLQRARWFGYRLKNDQFKFMKIFMNQQLINSYKEINDSINLLKNHDYLKPKEIKQILKQNLKHYKYIKFTNKKGK